MDSIASISVSMCLHGMEYRCKRRRKCDGYVRRIKSSDAEASRDRSSDFRIRWCLLRGRRRHRHSQEGDPCCRFRHRHRGLFQRPDVRIHLSYDGGSGMAHRRHETWLACLNDSQHHRRHHRGRPSPRGAASDGSH